MVFKIIIENRWILVNQNFKIDKRIILPKTVYRTKYKEYV